MRSFVAFGLLALACAAAAFDAPGANTAPAGYTYVGQGTQQVITLPLRLSSAFEASSLIGTEIRDITEAECAALCDDLMTCRAYFYWVDVATSPDHPRCRLLRQSKQVMDTATQSVSATKDSFGNYYLAGVGNNAEAEDVFDSNGIPDPIRFANAFYPEGSLVNDYVFPTFDLTGKTDYATCLNACDSDETCEGAFVFYDSGLATWRCAGLKNIKPVFIATDIDCYSFGKIGFTTNNFVPQDYTLVEEGKTISNHGLWYRYSTAFEAANIIDKLTDLDRYECTDKCTRTSGCKGAFHYKLGSHWKCHLLNALSTDAAPKPVKTETVSYSYTRTTISPWAQQINATSPLTGNAKWTDAIVVGNRAIALPRNAVNLFVFYPETNTVDTTTAASYGTNAYVGSVLVGSFIYGIPYNAAGVLKVNTDTLGMSTIALSTITPSTRIGSIKRFTSAAVLNGIIYCSPFDAAEMLTIDTTNNDLLGTVTGVPAVGIATSKFVGTVVSGTKIVLIPFSAQKIAIYNTNGGSWSTIDLPAADFAASASSKWNGGFLASNGFVYGSPNLANAFLKIDAENAVATLTPAYTTDITLEKFKAPAVQLSVGGKYYLLPNKYTVGLVFDTSDDSGLMTQSFPEFTFGNNVPKFSGSFAYNGVVYGTPYDATFVGAIHDLEPVA